MLPRVSSLLRSAAIKVCSYVMQPRWLIFVFNIISAIALFLLNGIKYFLRQNNKINNPEETLDRHNTEIFIHTEIYINETIDALDSSVKLLNAAKSGLNFFPIDKCVRNVIKSCNVSNYKLYMFERFLISLFNVTKSPLSIREIDDNKDIDKKILKECIPKIINFIKKSFKNKTILEKLLLSDPIELFKGKQTSDGSKIDIEELKKTNLWAILLYEENDKEPITIN